MVSCQKGPTRHAYAWQIGLFWQDTPDKQNRYMYIPTESQPAMWHPFLALP